MTKKQFAINVIAFILAWIALPLLLACDTGCEEHSGVCACNELSADRAGSEVKPSNEKPPDEKMPSYERAGIIVDIGKPGVEPSTMTEHDYSAEGKQR